MSCNGRRHDHPRSIVTDQSFKRQATSSLTAGVGYDRMYLERNIMEHELKRIADALEEVIRMVKKDQQETKERFEKRWDKEDE